VLFVLQRQGGALSLLFGGRVTFPSQHRLKYYLSLNVLLKSTCDYIGSPFIIVPVLNDKSKVVSKQILMSVSTLLK